MTKIACPNCKKVLQASAEQAGMAITCPNCQGPIHVPKEKMAAAQALAGNAGSPTPMPAVEQWFFSRNGKQQGPVTGEQLRGMITPNDLVWKQGLPQWAPASTIPNLLSIANPSSNPPPPSLSPGSARNATKGGVPPSPNGNAKGYRILEMFKENRFAKIKVLKDSVVCYLKRELEIPNSTKTIPVWVIVSGVVLFLFLGVVVSAFKSSNKQAQEKNVEVAWKENSSGSSQSNEQEREKGGKVAGISKGSKVKETKPEENKFILAKEEKRKNFKSSNLSKPDSEVESILKSIKQFDLMYNPTNDPRMIILKKDTSLDVKAKNFCITSDYLPKIFKPKFFYNSKRILSSNDTKAFYYCDEKTGDAHSKVLDQATWNKPPVITKRTETASLITLGGDIEIKLDAKLGDTWTSNERTYKVACFGMTTQISHPVIDPKRRISFDDTKNVKFEYTNTPEPFCIIDCKEKNGENGQFVLIKNYGLYAVLSEDFKFVAISDVIFNNERYGNPSDYPYFVDMLKVWALSRRLAEAKAEFEKGMSREEKALAKRERELEKGLANIEREIEKVELEMEKVDEDSNRYKFLEKVLLDLEKRQGIYEIAIEEEISYTEAAKIASQGVKQTQRDLGYIKKNKKVPPK